MFLYWQIKLFFLLKAIYINNTTTSLHMVMFSIVLIIYNQSYIINHYTILILDMLESVSIVLTDGWYVILLCLGRIRLYVEHNRTIFSIQEYYREKFISITKSNIQNRKCVL